MIIKCYLFLVLSLAVLIFCHPALAENQEDFFSIKKCGSYSSEKEFVEKAGLYCVNSTHTRSCMKKARSFFKDCRYNGDFKRIAASVQKKLLVMLLITKSTDFAKHL